MKKNDIGQYIIHRDIRSSYRNKNNPLLFEIVCFQTNRKNNQLKDPSNFDNIVILKIFGLKLTKKDMQRTWWISILKIKNIVMLTRC